MSQRASVMLEKLTSLRQLTPADRLSLASQLLREGHELVACELADHAVQQVRAQRALAGKQES